MNLPPFRLPPPMHRLTGFQVAVIALAVTAVFFAVAAALTP